MFNRKSPESLNPAAPASPFTMEALEERRFLSGGQSQSSIDHGASSGPATSVNYRGTLLFSQAPTVVRNGLTALATTTGVSVPTTSQVVSLISRHGVEAYTIKVAGTGGTTSLTVDVNGNPIGAGDGEVGGGGCVGGGFGIDFGRNGQLGFF